MKTIIISYDAANIDKSNVITDIIVSFDNDCRNTFEVANYQIGNQDSEIDCEDYNDNARWLVKTLLEILKLEHNDPDAHCDWSADSDVSEKVKYKFNVEIKKVKGE